MKQFINEYFSELIVFFGIGIAKLIILTALAFNGMLATWVQGLLAPWQL